MTCRHCGWRTQTPHERCLACGAPLPQVNDTPDVTFLGPPAAPHANAGEGEWRLRAAEETRLVAPAAADEESTTCGAAAPQETLRATRHNDMTPGTPDAGLAGGTASRATRPGDANDPPVDVDDALEEEATSLASTREGPGTPARGPGGTAGASGEGGPLGVGHSFGPRYHIIRLLGLGGMGAVYQAWDAELGVAVALKVVRPEVAAEPAAARDLERRFKRELLLARQVTHKNVVRIHDLGEIDGIKYITMPYVEGADLSTVLARDGKLPVARVLRIARTIVAGLLAAHEAGVVHRDLKPANIMIGGDDEALIMDFGIARSSGGPAETAPSHRPRPGQPAVLTQETMSGAIVGTVQYMAPEQARGEPVDHRADIYAFGLILYDMLVGKRRATHAQSAVAELQGRMQQPPPSVRSIEGAIPEPLDRLITRCIESDADKRFRATSELAAALDRLDDEGQLRPVPRRFTTRFVAGLALVALVLAGGAFYAAKRLAAPPKQPDPVTVVIADFENGTGESAFDHTLEPMLRRALEGAGFITAYDRGRLRSTFGVRPPDTFDEVAAREFAVRQGLGVVLSGSVSRRGAGYDVSLRSVETVSQRVVAAVSARASQRDQVLAVTTGLAAKIRQALGDEASESAQRFAMRSLSTTSLDVVAHYAAAMDAQSRGQSAEALASFRRAVQADPEFGLGFQGMAAISLNLGRRDDAERYINEALRHLDGMTERERMSVRGLYYTMSGDYRQCATEYTQLIRRYAADTVAYNQLATCLAKLRDMPAAVDAMRQAVRILPRHVTYRTNLALLLNYAGEFNDAEREALGIEEPDEVAVLALAFSHLGRGARGAAAEAYQRLAAVSGFGASFAASGLGDLAVYEGRFVEAVQRLRKGVTADLAAGNRDAAARKLTTMAYAHLSQRDARAAVAAADEALALGNALDIRFLAGRVLIEAGAEPKARSLAADLAAEIALEPQAYGKVLDGALARKAGDPRQAIKILAEASTMLDTWFAQFELGIAYLEAGGLLQADGAFERCLRRRGEVLSLFDEDITYGYFPIVYYYQGRVRESLKTAGFAEAYRAYLAIRGQSPDDPLVTEIRARLGE
jgi:eukaryotic-like serine/threonine-protein kinase